VLREGTMWTCRAADGNCGRSSSASWVEYIIVPLGLLIPMGLLVMRLLITWAEIVQKCAVLPLSAMAVVLGGIMLGGPTGAIERQVQPEAFKTLCGIRLGSDWLVGGSPHRQLGATGRRRGRPVEIVLFPSCMRKAVALSTCPVALLRHVAEV
jgi:hypothetical protein